MDIKGFNSVPSFILEETITEAQVVQSAVPEPAPTQPTSQGIASSITSFENSAQPTWLDQLQTYAYNPPPPTVNEPLQNNAQLANLSNLSVPGTMDGLPPDPDQETKIDASQFFQELRSPSIEVGKADIKIITPAEQRVADLTHTS